MAGRTHEQFKIRMDDEPADLSHIDGVDSHRLEKLSRRLNLFSILIPIVLLGLITFVWMDTGKRVDQTQQEGSTGVQNLSKNLESRFSRLSIKQAELEDQLNKQLKIRQEVATQIQEQLSKVEKALKETDAFIIKQMTAKMDKQAMTERLSALTESIRSVQSGFKSVQSEFKSVQSQFKKDLLTGLETVQQDVEAVRKDLTLDLAVSTEALDQAAREMKKIRKDIAHLAKKQVNKTSIDRALAGQREYIRQNMNQVTASMGNYARDITENKKNIDLSQGKILELQRDVRALEEAVLAMRKKPGSAPLESSAKAPARPASNPEQPGNIQEQTIE